MVCVYGQHLMFVYMTFNEHSATSNTGNLRWSMAG